MQQQIPSDYVLVSTEQLAYLTQLARNGIDTEVMNYTYEDQKTGTRTNHEINLRRDGNKTADGEGNTWLHVGAHAGSESMVRGFIQQGGEELDLEVRNQEVVPL